ncbi:MAG: pilin [Candidatus Nomurabacteria bacterium]|nr:pilin [Candidatus Nomurabacteria bacterium]
MKKLLLKILFVFIIFTAFSNNVFAGDFSLQIDRVVSNGNSVLVEGLTDLNSVIFSIFKIKPPIIANVEPEKVGSAIFTDQIEIPNGSSSGYTITLTSPSIGALPGNTDYEVIVSDPDPRNGTPLDYKPFVTLGTGTVAKKISIASFTPTSAKAGGTIKVTGTNIVDVTKVTINTTVVDAKNYDENTAGTELTIKIPPGASTGKIYIRTNANGTATSPSDLTITTASSQPKWYFGQYDFDNKVWIIPAGGSNPPSYSTNIYATEALCKAVWQKKIDDTYLLKGHIDLTSKKWVPPSGESGSPSTFDIYPAHKAFTPCFSSDQVPWFADLLPKLQNFGKFEASKELYFFTWKNTQSSGSELNFHVSGGYETDNPGCKQFAQAAIGVGNGRTPISNGCQKYKKQPTVPSTAKINTDCNITNAVWNPISDDGKMPISFYKPGNTPVRIDVESTGCAGKSLRFTVTDFYAFGDVYGNSYLGNDYNDPTNLNEKPFVAPSDNFAIELMAGESSCLLFTGDGYDCAYSFQIDEDSSFFTLYNSRKENTTNGIMYYDCTGYCDSTWKFLDVKSGNDVENFNPAEIHEYDDTYNLLAPIGDLKSVGENTSIGDYLNKLFSIAIGLCGALAVIMMIINAVTYMGTDSVFGKTEAKSKIWTSIGGLLLALGAYAILNTINPALINGGNIPIPTAEIILRPTIDVPTETFKEITGEEVLGTQKYKDLYSDVATTVFNGKNNKRYSPPTDLNVLMCVTKVILKHESNGNPLAIGYDSDTASVDVKSRKDFIASGKRYSGTTFTTDSSSIKNKQLKNDDKKITTADDLGLDPRFSHGIGLAQITCQPVNGGTQTECPITDGATGKKITPKALLSPAKNIMAGVIIWNDLYHNAKHCKNNMTNAWKGYNAGMGNCDKGNDFTKKYADESMALYNKCMKGESIE